MKATISFIDHSKFPPNYWKWLAIALLILLAVVCTAAWASEINMVRTIQGMDIRLSKHFIQSEFTCKCCGETKINIQLIMALEELRQMLGSPIIITSGYRCPKHNKEVGGAKNSQHLYGNAVDIKVKGYTPQEVADAAKICGFTWTKTYKTWTHIDIRQTQLTKQ